MATTEEIAWNDGSGDKIYVTSDAFEGDQTILVSSDANSGSARSKTITFTAGSLTQTMTVNQEAAVVAIPYIRGGNGSYIDTGITPDNTTRVIVWARNFNPSSPGNTWMFGSREGGTDSAFAIFLGTGTAIGAIAPQYGNAAISYTHDAWATFLGYHKYELSVDGLYVDDVLISSVTSTSFTSTKNMYLFGLNNFGSLATGNMPIDICQVKIYKGGSLVRDYSPINSPTIGLYDSVSDTVFGNSGSGSFTYGTFSPNAFTRLDYIECTAEQGFDTGALISYSDSIVCKFRVTETSARQYYLLSSPTLRYVDGYKTACLLYFGTASSLNSRCVFSYGKVASSGTITTGNLYNSTNPRLTNLDIIFVKYNNIARLYRNHSGLGSTVTASQASSGMNTFDTCIVGGVSSSFPAASNYKGRIYYVGIDAKRSYVPAKVNDVAGMYDTYNDVFYPSETSTQFGAGPEV